MQLANQTRQVDVQMDAIWHCYVFHQKLHPESKQEYYQVNNCYNQSLVSQVCALQLKQYH